MKTTDSPLELDCDLADDLPLLPEELELVQDLLPELLKEMAWQNPKE